MRYRRTDRATPQIEPLDLRSITRESKKMISRIHVDATGSDERVLWITCGSLHSYSRDRLGRVSLRAHLAYGVTDASHDSAYAFMVPLIGMTWDSAYGISGGALWTAWIDPDPAEEIRIPSPGYDPEKLPDATRCDDDSCEGDPHLIVPDGYYAGPPTDQAAFSAFRGLRVQIYTGPAYDDKEE